jgi:membrane fusion protein (multidrug efflux system)
MVEMPRNKNFQEAAELSQNADVVPVTKASPELPVQAPNRNAKLKRGLLFLAILAATSAGVYYGHQYWTVGQYLESTDDAYVKADYTTVAPKVAGYISSVLVQDNQHVSAGQVLARIDDRDFRAALAQARADVEVAGATIKNLDAQIALQQSLVEEARAAIAATQASLTFAQSDADRYRDLMNSGSGTIQRAQQTESVRDQALAQLQRDQAGLAAARKKIDVLNTGREQAQAQHERSLAVARQAELNLSYTTIVAPVSGNVGARSLRVGQYVTAGTQLMAIVPLHGAYVVANFKETQLTFVRDGQPVEIRVDSYPDLRLQGHVDSLSPASGLEFALLPPDNATGNFTKIVQRIPVKIVLDDATSAGLLRAGMSVEPAIDTKATVVAMRENKGSNGRRNASLRPPATAALIESSAILAPAEARP